MPRSCASAFLQEGLGRNVDPNKPLVACPALQYAVPPPTSLFSESHPLAAAVSLTLQEGLGMNVDFNKPLVACTTLVLLLLPPPSF